MEQVIVTREKIALNPSSCVGDKAIPYALFYPANDLAKTFLSTPEHKTIPLRVLKTVKAQGFELLLQENGQLHLFEFPEA